MLYNKSNSDCDRHIAYGLAICLVAFSCSGCAGWGAFGKNVARNQSADIGPPRESRKEQVAQDFDKRRDDAQFDAAASAWQRGDAADCEQALQQLLARNPNYHRARLLLADLYLFSGQSDKAIDELSKVVAANPKDAVAQHSLAEALDAAGRRQESLVHYEAATQLEPGNEVYSLSYKTALGVIPPTAKQNPAPETALAAAVQQPPVLPLPKLTTGLSIGENQTTLSNSMQTAPKPLPPQPPFAPPTVAAGATAGHTSSANQNLGSNPVPGNGQEIGWRLSGSVNDPSQPRGFANPTANMNDWLQAMHFESTTVPPTVSAEAVASQPLPKQMDSLTTVEPASAVRVANHIQPSPSSHPAQPVVQAVLPVAEPIDPLVLQSPLQRAVAALAKGDTEAAIDAAARGLSRTPDQAAPLYRVLGAAHYRRGEYQAAQAALAQALSLDKSDALAFFLMGSTLAKQNEHEAAAKYLSEAARLDVRFAN